MAVTNHGAESTRGIAPNSKRMQVTLSTGQGRLHFLQAACAMKAAGIDVRVMTGWAPKYVPDSVINGMGRMLGRRHLASGMKKRRPPQLDSHEIVSMPFTEFFQHSLLLAARFGLISRSKATVLGWNAYGFCSRRKLIAGDVFLFRSGAGRGGVLEKAKERGLLTVADHSIAHPATMEHNLRSVYEAHGRELTYRPDYPFWRSVLADCRNADRILVNSDYVKQSFVESGFEADRIKVVYWGVRSDFISLKSDWRRKGPLRLLFTGGFDLRKGANLLIALARRLRQRREPFRLDIVGAVGDQMEIPRDLANSEDVVFHGFIPQDDLKERLRGADVYVFPSYAEGAAQSAMEAMAAGLPVIATRETGTPIVNGKNGLIVPRGDVDALTEAVLQMGADESFRQRCGRMTSSFVARELTWENYGRSVRQYFQGLLDSRPSTRIQDRVESPQDAA